MSTVIACRYKATMGFILEFWECQMIGPTGTGCTTSRELCDNEVDMSDQVKTEIEKGY